MQYEGKLYGKVGNSYFPLQETSEDFEKLRMSVGRSGEDYLLEIDRKDKHIEQLKKEILRLSESDEAVDKGGEGKIFEFNRFLNKIENDITYIPEDADLGQVLFDIRNRISKFLASEYTQPLPSYKQRDISAEEVIDYINRRIKELNDADASFCLDRWNTSLPDYQRSMAREESNKVTFARQELQQVLKQYKK